MIRGVVSSIRGTESGARSVEIRTMRRNSGVQMLPKAKWEATGFRNFSF